MKDIIESILISEEEISQKISEVASQITNDYKDEMPVIIIILKGAVVFATDIIRKIDLPLDLDFFSISSYGANSKSSGIVKIRKDIDTDICGRHVIVVEDIVDSGLSLIYIKEYLAKHKPASVKTCVLLDKPQAHKVEVNIDYKCFDIGNEFVVGYGLDYAEKFRNLPYIGILKKEIYS